MVDKVESEVAMADAKEVAYNVLENMLNTLIAIDRESPCGTDTAAYKDHIMKWVRAEKVINVRVETRIAMSEWIRCEDRLPDEKDMYLVSGKMKYDCEKEYEYFIDFADYYEESLYDYKGKYGGRFGTYNDWYEGQQEYEILAWMEVPEPYKGGDAE